MKMELFVTCIWVLRLNLQFAVHDIDYRFINETRCAEIQLSKKQTSKQLPLIYLFLK